MKCLMDPVKCSSCGRKYPYCSSPMIKDDLWESISREHWKGNKWIGELLCRTCMEKKLGRKIVLEDLGEYAEFPFDQDFLRMNAKEFGILC